MQSYDKNWKKIERMDGIQCLSSFGKCLAYSSLLIWSQQVREIKIKLNDEIALLGWFVGVRHSLTRNGLPVTRTVNNRHTHAHASRRLQVLQMYDKGRRGVGGSACSLIFAFYWNRHLWMTLNVLLTRTRSSLCFTKKHIHTHSIIFFSKPPNHDT